MKVNKDFIRILAEKKHGWVGHIIKDMDFLEFQGDVIQNLDKEYKKVEQIYYTVSFLEKEGLISVEVQNYGSGIPTFNPMEFWSTAGKESKYLSDRMEFINEMNKSNWGKDISITPSFYDFVDSGFKTERQIKEKRDLWIPVVAALLAAFFTAVFAAMFKGDPNSFIYLVF